METQSAPGRRDASGTPDDPFVIHVARIAQGDEYALKSLYDSLSARVLGLSFQILRDQACAEEAVVDVFAQVWRQASRYEILKGTVTTWVCTLARTRAIDLRRQRARHTTRETAFDAQKLELFSDPSESPFGIVAAGDRALHVKRALSTLPAEQRRAIEAAFFGGLSHTEIAAAFGQPLGTVKTRIRSGLVALRTQLALVEGEG